ncbi:WxL domain-containing protein [uncultured Vagococcus sp.]|uniref:WxL domain-containing protein n=1 Tax=uncultured Vagococcus sp. TaxID=189676 RepID=UPI0028D853AE|nr:WxL domain-containing protein [uncultured Vagococcus sp.]
MKKIIGGLVICGAVLVVSTTTVLAEEFKATTEGSVSFTTDKDKTGVITKPEEPGVVIVPEVDEGNKTVGDLRLQFVPSFKFGINELKVGEQLLNPTLIKYEQTVPAETGDKYIPHFIQVTDVRGKKQGWNLKVSSTTFKTSAGDELPYAKITFKQAKLSNDVYNATELADKVKTFADGGNTLDIPTEASQAALVMSTKTADATTDGTGTTIVLDDSYDKDKVYAATEKNAQVVLTKTNKDIPVIAETGQPEKVYKATITWTLTDAF